MTNEIKIGKHEHPGLIVDKNVDMKVLKKFAETHGGNIKGKLVGDLVVIYSSNKSVGFFSTESGQKQKIAKFALYTILRNSYPNKVADEVMVTPVDRHIGAGPYLTSKLINWADEKAREIHARGELPPIVEDHEVEDEDDEICSVPKEGSVVLTEDDDDDDDDDDDLDDDCGGTGGFTPEGHETAALTSPAYSSDDALDAALTSPANSSDDALDHEGEFDMMEGPAAEVFQAAAAKPQRSQPAIDQGDDGNMEVSEVRVGGHHGLTAGGNLYMETLKRFAKRHGGNIKGREVDGQTVIYSSNRGVGLISKKAPEKQRIADRVLSEVLERTYGRQAAAHTMNRVRNRDRGSDPYLTLAWIEWADETARKAAGVLDLAHRVGDHEVEDDGEFIMTGDFQAGERHAAAAAPRASDPRNDPEVVDDEEGSQTGSVDGNDDSSADIDLGITKPDSPPAPK